MSNKFRANEELYSENATIPDFSKDDSKILDLPSLVILNRFDSNQDLMPNNL